MWNVRLAATARLLDDYDRDVSLAWNIERMSIVAQKKDRRELPALKKFLSRRGKAVNTAPLNTILGFAATYGIKATMTKGPDVGALRVE